jgi:glycerol-3-phosphate dehydrogenase
MPTPKALQHQKHKVLVLGAGNFGSCLADHLADSEHNVLLWSRDASQIEFFNTHRKNPQYLKDHVFSSRITAIGPHLPDAAIISEVDVILFAIPTEGVRLARLPFRLE